MDKDGRETREKAEKKREKRENTEVDHPLPSLPTTSSSNILYYGVTTTLLQAWTRQSSTSLLRLTLLAVVMSQPQVQARKRLHWWLPR